MSIAFVRLANGQLISGPAVMDFGPAPVGSPPASATSLRFNLLQQAGLSGGFIDFGIQFGTASAPPSSATVQFNLMQAVGMFGGFIDFGNDLMRGIAPPPSTGVTEYQYFARRRLRR